MEHCGGVKEREVEEERACVVVESLREGRRGVLRRAENQPRREEEGGLGFGRGWSGRGRCEGRERKEVTVAVRSGMAVPASASAEEGSRLEVASSEREEVAEIVTWPKRRP